MVRKKKRYSVNFDVGKIMPPLFHKLPGQEFDADKSQVFNWIKNQPEFLEYIRQTLRQAGYIKYDPDTGLWVGVEYDDYNVKMPTVEEKADWEKQSAIDEQEVEWYDKQY